MVLGYNEAVKRRFLKGLRVADEDIIEIIATEGKIHIISEIYRLTKYLSKPYCIR